MSQTDQKASEQQKAPSDAVAAAKLSTESALKIAQVNAASAARTHELDMWSDIGSASAWPIAAVALAIIFRGQFRKLIEKLSDFKGFGVEAKFGKQVEELAEQVAETTEDTKEPSADSSAPEQPLGGEPSAAPEQSNSIWAWSSEAERNLLLSLRPDVAITDSWLLIERAADDLGANYAIKRRTISQLIRDLYRLNIIDGDTFEQINEARRLRNVVAHGHSDGITKSEASLYVHTAATLANRLREISKSPTRPAPTPTILWSDGDAE